MKLVIVESPTKCDTIGHYLGKGYKVMASKGHLRDLATSGKGGLGLDIEGDFSPKYVIPSKQYATVNLLKAEAKKANEVIIATDPDREGEAIGWHITQLLGLDPKTTKRLEFHEITEDSINEAINNPRVLDMNLVASQETRRIYDRIIGFKLSALMSKYINSKSAGRVQSATLKILCDFQKEINEFVPEEYWTLSLDINKGNETFSANIDKIDNKKAKIPNEDINKQVVSRLNDKKITVSSIASKNRTIESKPPFTTSTMQQEAFNSYKFPVALTSRVAQSLYEGVLVGDKRVGLITYIRTDSTALSNMFVNNAKQYISNNFGDNYVGKVRKFKEIKGSQDAHEAIRPTSLERTPEKIKSSLTNEQYKLYKLIYERAIESLMAAKVEKVTTASLETNGLVFKVEGVQTLFDGFEKASNSKSTVKELPNLKEGDVLDIANINNKQEFTKAPTQYSEAKIVKTMEELGIGRPSTYSSTIKTLKDREYVNFKEGILNPTEQGMKTSHVLTKYFPEFVDAKYTSQMEAELDNVQAGNETRTSMVKNFYDSFINKIKDIEEKMYKDEEKHTGEKCPICGADLVVKKGRHGEFIACSNFPNCKYIKKEEKQLQFTGETCPKCGKPLVIRKDRRGKEFIGCSAFPKCDYIKPNEVPETPKYAVTKDGEIKKCPKCGANLVEKRGKFGKFLGCSNYPNCDYMEKKTKKKGA